MMNSPLEILNLLRSKGGMAYAGEGVTQLQHAWQCAHLAQRAGAADALQLSCWLHDIGHLLSSLEGTPTLQAIDDRHEVAGADVLARLWGAAVAEPVRLHVAAKRYMVATRTGYRAKLSEDSVRSLALQGGPMYSEACDAFNAEPFADDAIRLRAWDDAAKQPGLPALTDEQALAELEVLMQRVARS